VRKSGIVISNSNANSHLDPIHVDVKVHLNSSNNTFTKTDVTQADPLAVANPFVTTIGGTRDKAAGDNVPNNLHFSQPISGNSDVNVGNTPTGTGSGHLWLESQNTYTGATMINGDHDSTVFIGVNNALPIATDVIFGSGSSVIPGQSKPKLDLKGHNQQINSLSHGNYGIAADYTVTNSGSADSTLTISGSTTPYHSFGGVISDGATNKLGLEKSGTSTLTLSNINTYSGPTVIDGGTLELAQLVDPDFGTLISTGQISVNSLITMNSSGTFQIKEGDHTVGTILGTGTVKVLSGTLTAESITADTLTIGDNGFVGATVPEPGMLVLLALAGAALIAFRFRRL
jgi:autotransporter-associated beta strand protein